VRLTNSAIVATASACLMGAALAQAAPTPSTPITHVIVLFQENV
jgi:phospholipase C